MSKIPETREEVKEYVKELPDSVEPIFCKTPDEVPTQNHGNTITTQPEDKSFSIIILKDVFGLITAVWIVAAHVWPQ